MDILSKRENQILELITKGFTNKDIGEELSISHRTVDTHRTNIMRKLNVNNVASLVALAIEYKNKL